MNRIKILTLTLLGAISVVLPSMGAGLNIKSYLKLAEGDAIYPNAEQLKMLEKVVPDDTYIPFPSIDNRAYWGKIAKSKEGQEYLAKSIEMLNDSPEVPISDELYRRANLEANRGLYKPRYYRTMDRMEHFLLSECMVNDGRFLPMIEVYARAIMEMKSWMHPNHDDDKNSTLEGDLVAIDLGARKFGFLLAITDVTLNEKLSKDLRGEISKQLKYRITDSYLNNCRIGRNKDKVNNSWIRSTSNWNSVCTSGSLLTIMTMSQNRAERVAAIGCAINSMRYYVSGFGADGYCSEGLGYWNYGFGHYLYLAHILYDYTDGVVDLFKFDNPKKLEAVANFPARYEIHNKFYAPFSDGVTSVPGDSDNFAYLMAAKHYGARKPNYFLGDESVQTIIGWADADKYTSKKGSEKLPMSTYFDDCGIVISRGDQKAKFSIAIKAGHNNENHNHNDVGSYFILLDNDLVAGDIGAPSYIAGAFSADNPARSSWGHPVPRINNKLQSKGSKFRGEITKSNLADDVDVVELDILDAYEVPELKSLNRTMSNNRDGKGEITITDEFEAKKAVTFGTAVMVNVDYKIKGNEIILNTGEHKVKVTIEAKGGKVVLKDEPVKVPGLRSGRDSFRIGVDFTKPLKRGSITVTYKPM